MNLDGVRHRRSLISVNVSLTVFLPSTSMLQLLLFPLQKVRWVTIEDWIPGPSFCIFPSTFHSLMPCNFSVSSTKSRVCTFAITSHPQSLSVLKQDGVILGSPYNSMQSSGSSVLFSLSQSFWLEPLPHSAYLESFTSSQWVTESKDKLTGGFYGSSLLRETITPTSVHSPQLRHMSLPSKLQGSLGIYGLVLCPGRKGKWFSEHI